MNAYDAVVVGSGFGGAVAACRLAERGRSVLVLERGRRWGRQDFPRPGQKDARWWFEVSEAPTAGGQPIGTRAGLFERRRFPGMQVIVAAGVGGGSLVYTNVQKVPPAAALQGWPAPISLAYLQPYYERVREMLEPSPLPHDLPRVRAFEAAHAKAGLAGRVERPALAIRWPADVPQSGTSAGKPEGEEEEEVVNRFGAPQKPCNLCGQCVFGCDRHAKNTLDLTYLKRAESLGAQIWPLCQVTRIEPENEGYVVSFRRLGENSADGKEPPEQVHARSLYLAAGSLGTTELLLRSRDLDRTLPGLSPRLGHGWSPNGDFFAGLLDSNLPIVPTLGPSVAAGYEAEMGEFYSLEGAIPVDVGAQHKSALRWANRLTKLLRFAWLRALTSSYSIGWKTCGDVEAEALLLFMGAFFLMGRDASDGRLVLDHTGTLQLLWNPAASEPLFNRMRRYLRELGRGYGGWMLVPEPWWPRSFAGTVHPLGGCGMGRDAAEGVVDPIGRVFGYPNLYVCDGSIFPRGLGAPPSMTIAALAEHIVEHSLAF